MSKYNDSIAKLKKFNFDKKSGGIPDHDVILDAYCDHLLDTTRELSEKDIDIFDKGFTDEENHLIEISKEYKVKFSGEFLRNNPLEYTHINNRESGEIDVIMIMPLELVCGPHEVIEPRYSYCLIGEVKSGGKPGNRPFEQVDSAIHYCVYPHFKEFDIKISDGFLVTDDSIDRIQSYADQKLEDHVNKSKKHYYKH